MAIENSTLDSFVDAIKQDKQTKDHIYQATVSRIDKEGVVYVNLPGSDQDTPTEMSAAEVKRGDAVSVEWRNNKLFIAGNNSNPAAGVQRVAIIETIAQVAREQAARANKAAIEAEASAADAQNASALAAQAAERAQTDADTAQDAAGGAILGLSEVQKIVGTLNWASKNAEYQLTEDMHAIPGKTYWTRSGTSPNYTYSPISYLDVVVYKPTTDTTVAAGKTYYEYKNGEYVVVEPVGTENPSEEGWYEFNLSTYYEIANVDETMEDYINSHLALTDDGLKIFRDDESGYLLLNEDGVELYDANRNPIATYGEGTVIGAPNGIHIELKSNPTMGFNDPIIGFYMGDSSTNMPVSYIDGSGLSIPHAVIVTSLQIGDEANGAWKWVVGDEQDPTAARHLKLIWIGA